MSFFNPINSQFKRLEKVFAVDPALDLSYAASLMHVRPDQAARSIAIMNQRLLFAPDTAVVEPRLSVLVRDERYLPLARLKRSTQHLQQSLQTAATAAERVLNMPKRSGARGRALSHYVQDVVDSALSGPGNRGINLADRTGSFLREFIGPDERRTVAAFLSDDISGVLSSLTGLSRQLADLLSTQPEKEWDPDFAPFLDRTTAMVKAWCSCIPPAQLPNASQIKTADKLSDRLEYEFVPQFQAFLDEIYSPKPRQPQPAKPQEEENPVLTHLEAAKRSFREQASAVQSPVLRESAAKLDQLLGRIISRLAVSPDKCRRSGVRSLQNTYLPMMMDLIGKYVKNEAAGDTSPSIQAAMRATEQLFQNEIPSALSRILEDLNQDTALDMASQAEALKDKLQLDGLVTPTPPPRR